MHSPLSDLCQRSILPFDYVAFALGATGGRIGLVEEAGLLVGDALEEGLELEPAGEVRAHEGVRASGRGIGNFMGLAGGFGEQLGLAGAVHGGEPPSGLVDTGADWEQAVIAEGGGLLRTGGRGGAAAFGSFLD